MTPFAPIVATIVVVVVFAVVYVADFTFTTTIFTKMKSYYVNNF